VRQRGLRLVTQLLAVDADLETQPVADQSPAVRIEDVAAERIGGHGAQRVVPRGAFVLRAREHLQEPEPGRERDEHERDDEREHLQA
jgi:hypothetical protein